MKNPNEVYIHRVTNDYGTEYIWDLNDVVTQDGCECVPECRCIDQNTGA